MLFKVDQKIPKNFRFSFFKFLPASPSFDWVKGFTTIFTSCGSGLFKNIIKERRRTTNRVLKVTKNNLYALKARWSRSATWRVSAECLNDLRRSFSGAPTPGAFNISKTLFSLDPRADTPATGWLSIRAHRFPKPGQLGSSLERCTRAGGSGGLFKSTKRGDGVIPALAVPRSSRTRVVRAICREEGPQPPRSRLSRSALCAPHSARTRPPHTQRGRGRGRTIPSGRWGESLKKTSPDPLTCRSTMETMFFPK